MDKQGRGYYYYPSAKAVPSERSSLAFRGGFDAQRGNIKEW